MNNQIRGNLPNPFVSIVIPVFNDPERLKTCLEALENQTYPKSLYEIIVVDNGSDEDKDIQGVVNQFSQAFATHESCPGSYAARNKGISVAKGDIIAFTDADCIPASDWIEKGTANLLRVPNCGLVAGKVKFLFKNPHQPTVVELYDSIIAIPQKKFIEQDKFGATANLFTFKSVLHDVGCFDGTLKSSGDKEWGNRVFSANYQQVYADDTCVSHPARYSYAQIFKQNSRVTGGWYDLKIKTGYSYTAFFKDLSMDLKPPLNTIFRIILGKNIWPWTDKTLSGSLEKIQFIFTILFVQYVIASERTRLYLGGSSKRG